METSKKRTVLVVDDDDGVLSILQHAMSLLGWSVLASNDAEKALTQWSQQIQEIDLLITDLHMPAMNGCELARRIRELHPTLPIIFVSGDSGSDVAADTASIPNHRYLKKPFRSSVFMETVTSFVG